MTDALTQEEIDALLKGAGSAPEAGAEPPALDSRHLQGLTAYADTMASTMGEMIGTFLACPAKVTAQKPAAHSSQTVLRDINGNLAVIFFAYENRLAGCTSLVFQIADACRIGGTMVGDPNASSFADMVADAFKEVISTVVGNLNTNLARPLGGPVTNTLLESIVITANADEIRRTLDGSDQMAMATYRMRIGDGPETQCWQLFSMDLVDGLKAMAPAPAQPAASKTARDQAPAVMASPVQFDALSEEVSAAPTPTNLNLLMDIELEVRVELGRSNMKIRDVLKLGAGSVVELDKLAGEPVELLVNDVIFARGEVVVIDENFGVRIMDILSLNDRVKSFGERKI